MRFGTLSLRERADSLKSVWSHAGLWKQSTFCHGPFICDSSICKLGSIHQQLKYFWQIPFDYGPSLWERFYWGFGPYEVNSCFPENPGTLNGSKLLYFLQQQNYHEISIPLTKDGTATMFPSVLEYVLCINWVSWPWKINNTKFVWPKQCFIRAAVISVFLGYQNWQCRDKPEGKQMIDFKLIVMHCKEKVHSHQLEKIHSFGVFLC